MSEEIHVASTPGRRHNDNSMISHLLGQRAEIGDAGAATMQLSASVSWSAPMLGPNRWK
jgi:hypothetical protein